MKKTAKTTHVKVTHAHHKPYRKRHYAVLIASIALGIGLINAFVMFANNEYLSSQVASQTIADLFSVRDGKTNKSRVSSTYGFSLSYDTNRYYSSAVVATSGDLHVGAELTTGRAYNAIRLSDQRVNVKDASSFKLTYYQNDKPGAIDLSQVERSYVIEKQVEQNQLIKIDSEKVTYDGVQFLRTEWYRQLTGSNVSLNIGYTTYVGLVNGSPLTVIASQGLGENDSADEIMKTLTVSTRIQAAVPISRTVASKYSTSLSLLDKMLGVATASAAPPTYTAAERISATYSPAVVKVYNIMVGDLAIDGRTVLRNQIAGGTGSGFIVSSDGYIATNGHVAVVDARDEIIRFAIEALLQNNITPMTELITMAGITESDIAGAKSQKDVLVIIVKKLYELAPSRFAFVNSKQNLLVGLGEKQIDTQELVKITAKKTAYPEEATIKSATLKQSNFDGTILPIITGQFTKSDVALIKINGSNYPMVKLGDINSISQGGNLNIMGFPGVGSSNGLVSQTKTAATLTTGKVSSKKKDTGNRNLIETDTEIGHGNSGGPAFDDTGEVVGIATYAVDPGGSGDGALNYVRDIDDFVQSAGKSSVDYALSDTQLVWNQGIQQFYTARYKKAVASFAKVKELYPEHPRVAELTLVAEKRIANGENVDDFPVLLVVVLGVVVLTGAGVSVFFIVRHKRGHNALVQGVVSGQVQPLTPDAPAQMIPAAVPPAQLFGQAVAPVQSTTEQAFQPAVTPQPATPALAYTPVAQPAVEELSQQQSEGVTTQPAQPAAEPAPQPENSKPQTITVSDGSQAPTEQPNSQQ